MADGNQQAEVLGEEAKWLPVARNAHSMRRTSAEQMRTPRKLNKQIELWFEGFQFT